ncbi:glycosyltransferase 87 family protein [Amycolatopsis nigrescens]|uniref:glycosyltransferase 87 family protein n=1 Tax=Amycolatopsis nigrescens TaxID=381445 RepID=UPI000363A70B|nr:glycosyltransferase 87 family protein [Amycolatopsis nigrescens]
MKLEVLDKTLHKGRTRCAGTSKPWLGLLVPAVVLVAAMLAGRSGGYVDLQVYRSGVRALLAGRDLYGELPPTTTGSVLPYIYPPFSALVLTPMALTPWPVAATGTLLLSAVALAVTLYMVIRRVRPGWGGQAALVASAVALPAALVLEPVRSTLGFGQVNLWLMALVATDCLGRPPWPRGLLIGLAAAIKVTPAAFLLFFLVRKDFRTVRTIVLTGAGATAAAVLVAPAASLRYWTDVVFGASGMSGSPYATNQTIVAELNRLGLPSPGHLLLGGLLVLLVVAAAVVIMKRVDAPTAMVVNATAALVISPISWSHHWVWIVPALVLLAARARSARTRLLVVLLAVVFLIGPHTMVASDRNRELDWNLGQHLLGNGYLLLALAGLGWFAWRLRLRPSGTMT